MKLKRFNEAKKSDNKSFIKWYLDFMKYSNLEILEYFSQFTDIHEFEYDVLYEYFKDDEEIKYDSFCDEIKSLDYDDLLEIIDDEPVRITIIFGKDLNDNDDYYDDNDENGENEIDEYIKFGEALKAFKTCLHQFKNMEEGVSGFKENYDLNDITISFIKNIPEDVKNNFLNSHKAERESKEKNEIEKRIKLFSGKRNLGLTNQQLAQTLNKVIDNEILPDNVYDRLEDIDGDYEVDYDLLNISLNSFGERILTYKPIIVVDGIINDELTNMCKNITYNFENEEIKSVK